MGGLRPLRSWQLILRIPCLILTLSLVPGPVFTLHTFSLYGRFSNSSGAMYDGVPAPD